MNSYEESESLMLIESIRSSASKAAMLNEGINIIQIDSQKVEKKGAKISTEEINIHTTKVMIMINISKGYLFEAKKT